MGPPCLESRACPFWSAPVAPVVNFEAAYSLANDHDPCVILA
jgi:hypothetical protein